MEIADTGREQEPGRQPIDREVRMTRPKFRRSLRFENLETRQLMSAGGPTAQEQYMLELINQARTNPQAAADRVTSNLTPDVVATLNYYGTST